MIVIPSVSVKIPGTISNKELDMSNNRTIIFAVAAKNHPSTDDANVNAPISAVIVATIISLKDPSSRIAGPSINTYGIINATIPTLTAVMATCIGFASAIPAAAYAASATGGVKGERHAKYKTNICAPIGETPICIKAGATTAAVIR